MIASSCKVLKLARCSIRCQCDMLWGEASASALRFDMAAVRRVGTCAVLDYYRGGAVFAAGLRPTSGPGVSGVAEQRGATTLVVTPRCCSARSVDGWCLALASRVYIYGVTL